MCFKPAWALLVTLFTIASCTTIEHRGKCPVAPPGVNTICLVQCNGDASCSVNEKCCTFGCRTLCTPAVHRDSHPGVCPARSESAYEASRYRCYSDGDCEKHEKCCKHCKNRYTCKTAVSPVSHSSSCPVHNSTSRRSSSCKDRCSSDIDCEEDEKCCSNSGGCGQSCQPTRVKHKGYCPPQGGIRGPCIEDTCNDDGNCKEDEKCCDTGCSKICKPSLPVLIKPGACPSSVEKGEKCRKRCKKDCHCKGNLKCCKIDDRSMCVEPLYYP